MWRIAIRWNTALLDAGLTRAPFVIALQLRTRPGVAT
jgi:hypothetical protein